MFWDFRGLVSCRGFLGWSGHCTANPGKFGYLLGALPPHPYMIVRGWGVPGFLLALGRFSAGKGGKRRVCGVLTLVENNTSAVVDGLETRCLPEKSFFTCHVVSFTNKTRFCPCLRRPPLSRNGISIEIQIQEHAINNHCHYHWERFIQQTFC